MTHHSSSEADHASTTPRRALVLGGAGSAGNAWLIGLIAGLQEAGVDLTTADLTIGTSAGATTAAQITAASPSALLDAILTAPAASARRSRPPGAPDPLAARDAIIAASADPADMRRRLGAAALAEDASRGAEHTPRWRALVASRLPRPEWPAQRVVITAVDARTGDPVLLDRGSGVELVDAVAASCSSGIAYRIGEDRLIDGGFRTNSVNADLAAGAERALVLSPFGDRSRVPREWAQDLPAQIAALRAAGTVVETVFPGPEALDAFGDDVMSPAARLPAAVAGRGQGRALAPRLREFWS